MQGEVTQACPLTETELQGAELENSLEVTKLRAGGNPVSRHVGFPPQERDLEEGSVGENCSLSAIQIHTSETLFSNRNKRTKCIHDTTCVNLEDMLSERKQTQKITY